MFLVVVPAMSAGGVGAAGAPPSQVRLVLDEHMLVAQGPLTSGKLLPAGRTVDTS